MTAIRFHVEKRCQKIILFKKAFKLNKDLMSKEISLHAIQCYTCFNVNSDIRGTVIYRFLNVYRIEHK